MKKILNILNSPYFLVIVIGLSVLVIIAGVLIIKDANEKALIYSQQQDVMQQEVLQQQPNDQSTEHLVQQLEQLAASAESELAASKSDASAPAKDMDFIPEESRKKVEQMKNKNPDPGTEDWCELLMVKPAQDWSEEEQGIFAKNCLD
jgi:hypothetical protein